MKAFSILKVLKKNTTAGPDHIKAEPIIAVADVASALLCHIDNSGLGNDIYPDPMKIAKLVLLHKRGYVVDLYNYRRISILSIFLKTLKRLQKGSLIIF